MTDRKRIRNRIYRICGAGMLFFEIVEIILLHLFGFAWLTKGEAFPCFNDVEQK